MKSINRLFIRNFTLFYCIYLDWTYKRIRSQRVNVYFYLIYIYTTYRNNLTKFSDNRSYIVLSFYMLQLKISSRRVKVMKINVCAKVRVTRLLFPRCWNIEQAARKRRWGEKRKRGHFLRRQQEKANLRKSEASCFLLTVHRVNWSKVKISNADEI